MNTINEMFLSEYFFVGAILGKYLIDNKKLFFSLGNLFYIPNEKLDNLFALTEEQAVKEITSEKDYSLYLRIKKYSQLTDLVLSANNNIDEMITIKGNALTKAAKLNLISTSNISHNNLYDNLVNCANCGLIDAMRVLGILQCEGIFVAKNLSAGMANLKKAANWNDIKSIVALLTYSTEMKEYNLSRLYMLVKDTPFYELYEQATKVLNSFQLKEIKETKLLVKAFNSSTLKPDVYLPKYARVLYSKAISLHDKEKAIFNPGKEVISAIADLPIKVAQNAPTHDISWLSNVALYRKSEQGKIAANLGYNTRSIAYRTLCLCSDTKYLLKMYASGILGLKGVNIENIVVSDLSGYDLEPSANNVFVRSIDEDKNNIFLIYVFGEVAEQVIDNIKGFLVTEKRSKFHLSVPNVTIDLSNILPIVFCDKHNMQRLADVCDMVELADVSQKEMPVLVENIVESKKCEYNISQVKCSDDLINCLNDMSADEIEKCIDKAIRTEAMKTDAVQLNKDILTKYKEAVTRLGNIGFGFGGAEL